jgi:hypothetical protein
VWRGYDIGSPLLFAAADIALYGHPVTAGPWPTAWGVRAGGALLHVGTARANALVESRLTGMLVVSRLIQGTEGTIELLGSAYRELNDPPDANGVELGVGVRRLRVPIFAEPDVVIDGELLWDGGRLDGMHGNIGLGLELNPPMFGQRLTLRLGGRTHADSYTSESFRVQGVQGELGAHVLMLTRDARTLSFTGSVLGQRARGHPVTGWVEAGLVLR